MKQEPDLTPFRYAWRGALGAFIGALHSYSIRSLSGRLPALLDVGLFANLCANTGLYGRRRCNYWVHPGSTVRGSRESQTLDPSICWSGTPGLSFDCCHLALRRGLAMGRSNKM